MTLFCIIKFQYGFNCLQIIFFENHKVFIIQENRYTCQTALVLISLESSYYVLMKLFVLKYWCLWHIESISKILIVLWNLCFQFMYSCYLDGFIFLTYIFLLKEKWNDLLVDKYIPHGCSFNIFLSSQITK